VIPSARSTLLALAACVAAMLAAAPGASAASTWILSNDVHGGGTPITFGFGQPGDVFLSGDWNGDGTDTPGVFRPASALWILSNSTTGDGPLITFTWGASGDAPLTGDWNGDGTDTVGLFRRIDGGNDFYLGTSFAAGGGNPAPFLFGGIGDDGITGDWDGDGTETVGTYRVAGQTGKPDFIESPVNGGASTVVRVTLGDAGDIPLTGDWDGNRTDTPGVFRGVADAGRWGIANSNPAGPVAADGFGFGNAGDTPVVGDWDGNDTDTPALVRPAVDFVPAAPAPGSPAGEANGANASRAARLTVAFVKTKARSLRTSFGAQPAVTGRLVDEHGTGIGTATVVVQARRRQFRAATSQIDTLTTRADGSFSYRVPSGPARLVTFAYSAFPGDAKPASTASLRTLVRAALSATASPSAPRGGERMRLTGTLRYLPRANVQVTIQARTGKSWNTVGTVKTRAGGSYSWPHTFTRAQRGRTFTLRAHVDSPVYPFTPGNSRAVSVRVR
jgi:hypothetical protein